MKILLALFLWVVGYSFCAHWAGRWWKRDHGGRLPEKYDTGLLLAWPFALLLFPILFAMLLIFRAYILLTSKD